MELWLVGGEGGDWGAEIEVRGVVGGVSICGIMGANFRLRGGGEKQELAGRRVDWVCLQIVLFLLLRLRTCILC